MKRAAQPVAYTAKVRRGGKKHEFLSDGHIVTARHVRGERCTQEVSIADESHLDRPVNALRPPIPRLAPINEARSLHGADVHDLALLDCQPLPAMYNITLTGTYQL
jgi:hypothetical protein